MKKSTGLRLCAQDSEKNCGCDRPWNYLHIFFPFQEMLKSKLPDTTLAKVWHLADCDKDGYLTEEEFAIAMYLIDVKLRGHSLPEVLPDHLVPPKKCEYCWSK